MLEAQEIFSDLPITSDDANQFLAILGDLLVSAVSLWLQCSLSSLWIAYLDCSMVHPEGGGGERLSSSVLLAFLDFLVGNENRKHVC